MTHSYALEPWQDFIEGVVYPDNEVPWRDDPAYAAILGHPGLRDSIGGHVAPALRQAIGLVQALAQVDLLAAIRVARVRVTTEAGSCHSESERIEGEESSVQGLCLGFGTNVLEPYDLLKTLELDCVHAYEWIGEHITEAAKAFETLRTSERQLSTQVRLHHGTGRDLSALTDSSIYVIYTANMFTREIPMTEQTFEQSMQEILRVLASSGFVISRGSAGILEQYLAQHVKVLLQNPLVSVLQKVDSETISL